MPASLTQRLIEAHRIDPDAAGLPLGAELELALGTDHVIFGEAASTVVVPAFESLEVPRAAVAVAIVCADRHSSAVAFKQTVDLHGLQAWAVRRGVWFSRPGNGSPEMVHRERHAAPGRLMIAAGTTPPSCGALAMLGLASGELEVASALAGSPVLRPPATVIAARLFGAPGAWVCGQDVALELLRQLMSTAASAGERAAGAIIEFGGPGLASLAMADRFALASHAGTLGAAACVFPSDDLTRAYLAAQGRDTDWKRIEAEEGAKTDRALDLDLSLLEPLVSPLDDPAGMRPAHQWADTPVAQIVLGPRASYADLALVARVLAALPLHDGVQLLVVPGSRQIEETAARDGVLEVLLRAGARVSDGTALPAADGQAAGLCFGVRPEHLPAGRARWYLGGPACCAAAAVTGRIADPRDLEVEFTRDLEPGRYAGDADWLLGPASAAEAVAEVAGAAPPRFPRSEPLEAGVRGSVLLRVGDGVGTDQILPWGARMAPLIGDLPALADHVFVTTDPEFAARARARKGGFVVAGREFGAGAPRLYAALALLELGVRATLALSYAPAFRAQLVQAGILPLCFTGEADAQGAAPGDELEIPGLQDALEVGRALTLRNLTQGVQYAIRHDLGPLECAIASAGGRLAWAARALPAPEETPARPEPEAAAEPTAGEPPR
ncbi:MAG TPA: aconitase family protein [Candidatus Eisenbacteria bacterium]